MKFTILALTAITASAFSPSSFTGTSPVTKSPMASSSTLSMKYTVAVVGGGPSGACAAEIFAQEKGINTVMFERKFDNAKPCGGAIPLCMVGEFDLPESVVDRKVCLLYHSFVRSFPYLFYDFLCICLLFSLFVGDDCGGCGGRVVPPWCNIFAKKPFSSFLLPPGSLMGFEVEVENQYYLYGLHP
jgi:hypothetical protein